MADRDRLFVHIGLQKTGTSYLQQILWASTDALAAQGVGLVPATKLAMFRLMLDVRQRHDASVDPRASDRALARLPGQLAKAPPTALITQESLSTATPDQVRRLLDHTGEREVHVIITLRDLGRQIPSAWQQTLQRGGSRPMDQFVRRLRKTSGNDSRVWATMNAPHILDTWLTHVPAERIHLVTVPPSGAPKDQLLERFCSVLGVDHTRLAVDPTSRANRGLRAEHAEVLRRVNAALPEEAKRRDLYGDIGKRYFAVQILGDEAGSPIRLPASDYAWCTQVAQEFIGHLQGSGCPVVGDLDDLLPVSASFSDAPVTIPEETVSTLATRALSAVLTDLTEQRRDARAAQPAPATPPRRRSVTHRLRAHASRVRNLLRS